jgi:hypothetical protein
MKEDIYREARKTWNGTGQEARKVLVRWFALTKNLREMFAKLFARTATAQKTVKQIVFNQVQLKSI